MLMFLINFSDKCILNYFAGNGLFFLHSGKKVAHGFHVYRDFESGKYVHFDDLPYFSDHICGNLNADYTPYYKYRYNM